MTLRFGLCSACAVCDCRWLSCKVTGFEREPIIVGVSWTANGASDSLVIERRDARPIASLSVGRAGASRERQRASAAASRRRACLATGPAVASSADRQVAACGCAWVYGSYAPYKCAAHDKR
eukprot:2431336-Pleurochrysis_carterae.AAC.5